jgi:hypothetical protein
MDDEIRRRRLGAGKGFAAYAALHPDCRRLARTPSGKPLQQAPLIVFHGALNSCRAAEYCPVLETAGAGGQCQCSRSASWRVATAGRPHDIDARARPWQHRRLPVGCVRPITIATRTAAALLLFYRIFA